MHAVVCTGNPFKPRLVTAERPMPKPGAHDVLVRVHASCVNPKDWKLNLSLGRTLSPLGMNKAPAVFGDDLAGVVVATGKKVKQFKVGDEVYGMDMNLRTAALAEYAVISSKRIALKPKNLSFEDAAGTPLAALTALQGLRVGKALAGSRVLIIGASGGVGTLAVQIAKALNCHVTGVCGTRNLDHVRDLGADEVIDRHQGDFREGGQVFDLIFDVTSYESADSCAKLMKPEALFVSTAGQRTAYLGKLGRNRHRHKLVFVDSNTQDLQTLAQMFESEKIRPVTDKVFPLEEVQRGYEYSQSGQARGKIVFKVHHPAS